jgi:hypothetical protein
MSQFLRINTVVDITVNGSTIRYRYRQCGGFLRSKRTSCYIAPLRSVSVRVWKQEVTLSIYSIILKGLSHEIEIDFVVWAYM